MLFLDLFGKLNLAARAFCYYINKCTDTVDNVIDNNKSVYFAYTQPVLLNFAFLVVSRTLNSFTVKIFFDYSFLLNSLVFYTFC